MRALISKPGNNFYTPKVMVPHNQKHAHRVQKIPEMAEKGNIHTK